MPTASPMPSDSRGIPRIPRAVLWTVAALAIVQFLQWTVVLPADVQGALGFRRGDIDLGRWWTTFTFPLAHRDVTLLFLNAYALVVFGSRLEMEWGKGRFVAFLAASAVGGWMLHLISGSAGLLLGASALAFAVLAAYAIRWGQDTHLLAGGFEVRGRWMTLFVGAMILLVGLRAGDGGGAAFLAHLGGIAAGWLFVRATPVLMVERLREGVSALPDDPPDDQPPRAIPKTLPRSRARDRETIDDVLSRTNAAAARRSAPRRRAQPEASSAPQSIDALLDKISAEGMAGLSDEERRMLDDHSRRLRDG
jgi:membrane associated rhomboid family serine protease